MSFCFCRIFKAASSHILNNVRRRFTSELQLDSLMFGHLCTFLGHIIRMASQAMHDVVVKG